MRASTSMHAAETEAAILEAARDLLAEGGLSALSMRAVAARIGLSATAIYRYFDCKEDLVDRVVKHGFQRSESYLWRAIEDLPVGSMERIAALGEAYIRFAIENEQYFKIIFAIQPSDPREIEDLPAQGGCGVLRQCVVDAMEAGTIRRADPELVVLYLWSVAHGLVTIFMACNPLPGLEDGTVQGPREELLASLYRQFREWIVEGLRPGGEPEPHEGREAVEAAAVDGAGVEGEAEEEGR
ncbi:MAG: TetR/AcrR family transcriptional regulator [Gemmatimonadota bacterium]